MVKSLVKKIRLYGNYLYLFWYYIIYYKCLPMLYTIDIKHSPLPQEFFSSYDPAHSLGTTLKLHHKHVYAKKLPVFFR